MLNKTMFETSQDGALYIADSIEVILQEKPSAVLCLAAGHSSLEVFAELIKRKTDFSKSRFVGLDDWLNISPESDGSCARFLKVNFLDHVNFRPENIRLFDSLAQNPKEECEEVEKQISLWGGIDYILLGMGMNGHLALNEPGEELIQGARVVPLDEVTKNVAVKYFSEGMPPITHGITLGIKNILAARKIQLGVFGEHKKEPMEKLLSYKEPNRDFPASALLLAENAQLVLDKAAN